MKFSLAWDQAPQWAKKAKNGVKQENTVSPPKTTSRLFFFAPTPIFSPFSPYVQPGPSLSFRMILPAEADSSLLDLHNSSDHAKTSSNNLFFYSFKIIYAQFKLQTKTVMLTSIDFSCRLHFPVSRPVKDIKECSVHQLFFKQQLSFVEFYFFYFCYIFRQQFHFSFSFSQNV